MDNSGTPACTNIPNSTSYPNVELTSEFDHYMKTNTDPVSISQLYSNGNTQIKGLVLSYFYNEMMKINADKLKIRNIIENYFIGAKMSILRVPKPITEEIILKNERAICHILEFILRFNVPRSDNCVVADHDEKMNKYVLDSLDQSTRKAITIISNALVTKCDNCSCVHINDINFAVYLILRTTSPYIIRFAIRYIGGSLPEPVRDKVRTHLIAYCCGDEKNKIVRSIDDDVDEKDAFGSRLSKCD